MTRTAYERKGVIMTTMEAGFGRSEHSGIDPYEACAQLVCDAKQLTSRQIALIKHLKNTGDLPLKGNLLQSALKNLAQERKRRKHERLQQQRSQEGGVTSSKATHSLPRRSQVINPENRRLDEESFRPLPKNEIVHPKDKRQRSPRRFARKPLPDKHQVNPVHLVGIAHR